MQCGSCQADNPSGAERCQRCQARLSSPSRVLRTAAVPQFDPLREPSGLQRAPRGFGVHSNPGFQPHQRPSQRILFGHAPSGKVVAMPVPNPGAPQPSAHTALPPDFSRPQLPAPPRSPGAPRTPSATDSGLAPHDPLFASNRRAPRRPAADESQSAFDFGMPQSHKPFSKVLQPAKGLSAAPIRLRLYSLLVDSIIVGVLSLMFAAAVFVAFRASRESFTWDDLQAVPWYLLVAAPVALSLCYKALWAVFEQPTVGLQCYGLDIVSMDGRRPTIGQRIVRALAGWLTVGGLVGALWTLVNQEGYSMQDMISQTFLTLRPGYDVD
jgi:uncharacterized RDD family membrane protein YckC